MAKFVYPRNLSEKHPVMCRIGIFQRSNSLVDANTKSKWAMATLCSTLKYFGRAVIGVARLQDRLIINNALDK